MKFRQREVSGAPLCHVGNAKRSTRIAVKARQQAPEEERKCMTAVQLLLTEIVRQQFGCQGERK